MCSGNEGEALEQFFFVLIPKSAALYSAERNNAACVHLYAFLSDHSTQPDSHWHLFPYTYVIHLKRVALRGMGSNATPAMFPALLCLSHLAAMHSPLPPCHKKQCKSRIENKVPPMQSLGRVNE